MSQSVGWGIVGTGWIARQFAEGLAQAPGARLVAVASRERARAVAFADRFRVDRAHASYEALARDPDVDIVYVATPNSDHRPSALMMIDAGKSLLCEKPFMLDATEARDVIALARHQSVFCMEAMWMRFMPAVIELVDRVRAGALGQVQSATIELGHCFDVDPAHRLFDPALGGGALLDLGVYTVSLAVLLFGPITAVKSVVTMGATGVDERVAALLSHAGGCRSSIGASLRTRLSNGATVAGTSGWAALHEPLYRPNAFTVVRTHRQLLVGTRPDAAIRPSLGDRCMRRVARTIRAAVPVPSWMRGATVVRPYRGNGYCHQAIEAMRCLRVGLHESPGMPLDDTLHVMEALDAIRKNWTEI
jgi:predicted dehydrogenase